MQRHGDHNTMAWQQGWLNGMAAGVAQWHGSSSGRHAMARRRRRQLGDGNCDDGGSSTATVTSAAAIKMAAAMATTTRQTRPQTRPHASVACQVCRL